MSGAKVSDTDAIQGNVKRALGSFTGAGYDKGRSTSVQALWFACSNLVFMKWWCPRLLRPPILRLFGARVGRGVFIRHQVRVLWPWKLVIGDDCWLGEGVWILNLEPVVLEHDVCLSQSVYVFTGSHDPCSPTFGYDNAAILIRAHAWIATRATILRGVTVEEGAVVSAGSLVRSNVASWSGSRE